MTTSGPAWLPDPGGRHQYRWWDGAGWTEVVADHGVEAVDPLIAQPPGAYPPGAGAQPPVAYQPEVAPGFQPPPSAPGAGTTGGFAPAGPAGPGGGSNRQTYTVLAILGATIAALLVVLVVVVDWGGGGGGGDDEPAGPEVAPREALTRQADVPAGWTESGITYPSGEDQVCEPRPEPPEPPRVAEASFERSQPSGSLEHHITETTPGFAAEVLSEARQQAGSCGTFSDEFESDGETFEFTATSELLTGPTFGDETVWYVIHLEYTSPPQTSHDILICLDRHDGVVSGFTLSTAPPTSDADRSMVEELARTAAERLEGGSAQG